MTESKRVRWSQVAEVVGTAAVVVSLIYVGLQVRQNTAAMQTSTSQAIYQQHQDQLLVQMQNPEFAELLLRARRHPETMTAIDSLRYDRYLNLWLNLREAVYTNALQGTMEPDMAAGWLNALVRYRCVPGMEEYWRANKATYHRRFQTAVDSAFALAKCEK